MSRLRKVSYVPSTCNLAIRRICLLAVLGSLAGCEMHSSGTPANVTHSQDSAPYAAPDELRLADQIEAVRDGRSNAIVATNAITDNQLGQLADLPGLQKLQLDNARVSDIGLQSLVGLPQLEQIVLRRAPVGDEGLRHICSLTTVKILNLPQARFTDRGLSELARLPDLELLRFSSPNVTDDGMQQLATLKRLRFLHLISVPISDAGLARLESLEHLESLYLDDIGVSDDAIESLWKAIPGLHLHFNQQHHDRDPHRHPH